jgi:hypothetical protein
MGNKDKDCVWMVGAYFRAERMVYVLDGVDNQGICPGLNCFFEEFKHVRPKFFVGFYQYDFSHSIPFGWEEGF